MATAELRPFDSFYHPPKIANSVLFKETTAGAERGLMIFVATSISFHFYFSVPKKISSRLSLSIEFNSELLSSPPPKT